MDNSDRHKPGKYNSQWAFTHFERRALWILSIFLISGAALRMYNNQQMSSGLELKTVPRTIMGEANDYPADIPVKDDMPVNLNTATQAELEQIPGIGPVKAKAIIDHINANGPIKNSEDILSIKGIGPATLKKIEEFTIILPQ